MAWVDPRFRTKKEKPKAIKLNKFGEAPCDIRNVVPARQNPITSINTSRANVNASSSSQRAGAGGPCGIRQPSTSRPTTARPPSARPTTARPPSPGGRPSTASSCAPPARPPPLAPRPCAEGATPPQVGVSWRMHQGRSLRPPTDVRQLRAPSQIARPCPSAAAQAPATCPPSPPRRPSPPPASPPCPPQASSQRSRIAPPQRFGFAASSTPVTSTQRSIPAPSVSGITSRLRAPGSSLTSSSGMKPKCQKIVLLPGDIDPQETTVITVEPPPPQRKREKSSSVRFVKTKSIKPAWVGPCPEPEPEPEPPRPQSTLLSFSPPRAGAPRRLPRFLARRLGGESSTAPCPDQEPAPCPAESAGSLVQEPCPQEDTCPYAPPPCPQEYPPPCPEEVRPPPCPEECPPSPCDQPPPDPNDIWFEQMLQGSQQQSCPSQQAYNYEPGENLLDITPPQDMRGFELAPEPLPEDLIQWEDPQDPWCLPPRAATPPPSECIDFVGKQDPFSPPKLTEYFERRYPQFREIHERHADEPHPLFYHTAPSLPPCPRTAARRSPTVVDREFLARPVPHNRQVSTLCRDDSEDEDDLGLLPDNEFETSFAQPLTRAREKYTILNRMNAEKLRRNAKERLELVKVRAKIEEEECNLRADSERREREMREQELLEAQEAARRVQERYARMHTECDRPPQTQELESNLGDYGDLGACELDDIDFEAIEAEAID